jgi:Spy/CpxP family protein refolding chaperone
MEECMTYSRLGSLTLALAALLSAAPAVGQVPPPSPRKTVTVSGDTVTMRETIRARAGEVMAKMQARGDGPDDFGRFLFPPELVMQHQHDIALTDAQRTVITGAIQKLESDVVAWQWKMTDEQYKLTIMVQATPIDSTATLAQIDKVLDLERQIKKGHMAMLVRIKNALTADQQHTLRELQPQWMPLPGGRGRQGGGVERGRRGGGPGGPGDSPEHN